MAGYTLHVVSHTHWDREWYMPFELHRRRLVRLLDDLLDVLDADPDFGSFHLDGQVIPLDDYLAVRPQQRARLVAAAQAGRLTVGPWYVLQDEFLTSGEAQVRNMLYGLRAAAEFGPPLRVGYLADAFGHIGQMPQLLAGFGIDNAVFGRGLNPLNPDAAPDAPPEERGYGSEVHWSSPDGSRVLGVWMTNWYNNAMDIPAEPEACVARLAASRDAAARFASTDHLLLMNGCDHTPCQLDISALLETARRGLDDTLLHSRLDDYVRAVTAAAPELPEVRGELRSRFTDGFGTLTNVLSTRLYLKQANWRCQRALEKYLEPLQAVTALFGHVVDRDYRAFLWKSLLANHPHDSICGCSADAVHREMETRFERVEALAGQLTHERFAALAARVDTSGCADGEVPVVVHNPLAFDRVEPVDVTLDFPDDTELTGVAVTDAEGRPVSARLIEDLGRAWDYRLPEDRFRETFHCRRVTIEITAAVPAFGHAVYRCAPSMAAEAVRDEPQAPVLENEHLRVTLRDHGTLDVLHKASGRLWPGLNALVCGPDQGDEYNYRPPAGAAETPLGHGEDDDGFWQPLDDGLSAEGYDLWTLTDEEGEPRLVTVGLHAALVGDRVEITARLHNDGAGDFRVRVLCPTDTDTDTVHADGHFEVVARPITPWHGWRNPSDCQPCLDFVDVSDARGGLTLANRGLPEYEVLRDGRNTVALTLLRAVGCIGDWGDFPTPDAQCQGESMAEYALIPHAGSLAGSAADLSARAYNAPLVAIQTDGHAGPLPPVASLLRLDPAHLVLSAVRWAEDRDAFLVRFYNPSDEAVEAEIATSLPLSRAWRCNLDEARLEALDGPRLHVGGATLRVGGATLRVGGKQIVTLELGA
jgi:alpha-mannosidase/mannosylglycerate hydrolase